MAVPKAEGKAITIGLIGESPTAPTHDEDGFQVVMTHVCGGRSVIANQIPAMGADSGSEIGGFATEAERFVAILIFEDGRFSKPLLQPYTKGGLRIYC